jgi:hypothetical protein
MAKSRVLTKMSINVNCCGAILDQGFSESFSATLGGRILAEENDFKKWFHGSAIAFCNLTATSKCLEFCLYSPTELLKFT